MMFRRAMLAVSAAILLIWVIPAFADVSVRGYYRGNGTYVQPHYEAGAINVASALGRDTETVIGREQLLAWDPAVIIAQDRRFYASVRRDRAWRRLSAVRNHRVYLEPRYPFGWIEDPSSINRLIGL
jgi:ABC-type Fe3+-hydroxamate transport system substrate-binding protein